MNEKSIADFHIGDEITGFYLLQRFDMKARRDNKGHFLAVDLADATGSIAANIWDDAEENARRLRRGGVVKIKGAVQSFQGRKQLSIQKIRQAEDGDEVDLTQLVPAVKDDIKSLWRDYSRFVDGIINPFMRSLLRKFTESEAFRNEFCSAVNGLEKRSARRGGLLQHTIRVARACEKLATVYPDLNKDLLLTGALLHDVGKIEAFSRGPLFELTEQGRLVGRHNLTAAMILKKVDNISAFPAELSMKLQHMIFTLAAEDIQPGALPEAVVLRFANAMDEAIDASAGGAQKHKKQKVETLNFDF